MEKFAFENLEVYQRALDWGGSIPILKVKLA